jgi:hypothetical protein
MNGHLLTRVFHPAAAYVTGFVAGVGAFLPFAYFTLAISVTMGPLLWAMLVVAVSVAEVRDAWPHFSAGYPGRKIANYHLSAACGFWTSSGLAFLYCVCLLRNVGKM